MRRLTMALIATLILVISTPNSIASAGGDCVQTSIRRSKFERTVVTCRSGEAYTAERKNPRNGRRPPEFDKSATRSTAPKRSLRPRKTRVEYCAQGTVYYYFFDTSLTMTAGISCESPSSSPRSQASSPVMMPRITEYEAAQVAANQLDVRVPELRVGPDWRANEWNMLAVGYPLWVWTDDSSSVHSSRTIAGMTISLSAPKPTLTVDYGDGTRQRCATTTPYSFQAWQSAPNHESPTCGHTYLKKGDYPLRLTATWQVAWSGPGHSGVIPVTLTSSAITVPVGELESVLVPVPK